jgi:cysteinyl-tRNA synthetase
MPELRLSLHDTLTSKPTLLVPKQPGEVRVYTCGPTTYDVAHIGHARAALAPDVLVRHLRAQGQKVTYVRNITDVDDKILKRAAEQGVPPMELSAKMARLYQEDVGLIGCVEPDVQPKVSEHIPEIVALIAQLIEKGAAYEVTMPSGAHDVYYAVRAFEGYGKLSKRNVDEMRVGARIEANEDKRDPLDFALWKGVVGDGWGWDSPWGKGRPGWHIECSAMSAKYLGHGFDVHCGGMDLIFPHHENEIAQSEAAHPGEGPFVNVWIHNGFVNVDKEKMAKSLGNFVTMRDVLGRNDPEGLRYFLLTVHYRGAIAFDTDKLPDGRVVFPGVLEAERRLDYLYTALSRLMTINLPSPGGTSPAKMPKDLIPFAKLAVDARGRVDAALNDDLDTPVALAVLAEVAKGANELADAVQRRKKDLELQRAAPFVAAQILVALRLAAEPLGLLGVTPEAYRERTQKQRLGILGMTAAEIDARLTERTAARAAKDFSRADELRKGLDALGIEVADSPEGSTWRVAPGGGYVPPPAP